MARALLITAISVGLALAGAQATGKGKKRRYPNMPKGWTWPPSTAMKESGARCLARLDTLGVAWKKAPRARKITTPIYVPSMRINGIALDSIWRKGPFVMDCHLARALAEVAPRLRAVGVRALRFTTIHDYRHVRKNKRVYKNLLSRHAIGLAVDVFEITDDRGEVHVVKGNYRGDDLLHAIEAVVRPSGQFRALLTPGNDPRSHGDHFHFEAGFPTLPVGGQR